MSDQPSVLQAVSPSLTHRLVSHSLILIIRVTRYRHYLLHRRRNHEFRELTRLCVRGGEWGSPVPNKPYGFCGRKALCTTTTTKGLSESPADPSVTVFCHRLTDISPLTHGHTYSFTERTTVWLKPLSSVPPSVPPFLTDSLVIILLSLMVTQPLPRFNSFTSLTRDHASTLAG